MYELYRICFTTISILFCMALLRKKLSRHHFQCPFKFILEHFFLSGTNSLQKKWIEVARVDKGHFRPKESTKKVNKIKATLILKLVRGRLQTTFLTTVSTCKRSL